MPGFVRATQFFFFVQIRVLITFLKIFSLDNSTESQAVGMEHNSVELATLVMFSVIFVTGTVGNGLVIYVTAFRMKRSVNSVWFLNLALADFLFTTFLIFTIVNLVDHHQWRFGLFMCKLNTLIAVINMFASIFLLTAVSVDRCVSIWVVVWAQNKRTVRKAQLISATIWGIAVICSTPFATFRELQVMGNATYCGYPSTMKEEQLIFLVVFRFVMGFLIPFLVIFVSYVAICVRAGRLQRTRKSRSRRIIFSIVFAFFICWLPFHVTQFIQLYDKNAAATDIVLIGGPLTLILAFANSSLNPILYVFMCDEFQKKLKKSLCFVLESALGEDHLSFTSSRSLSSQVSRISRKSDPAETFERKDAETSLVGKGVGVTEH